MTTIWNFHFLIRQSSLALDALRSLASCVCEAGFAPEVLDDGSVPAWSGDGSGFLCFSNERAAIEWLAQGEGLISYRDSDGSTEVSVSVHFAHGLLKRELFDVPDKPIYDDVVVTFTQLAGANPIASGHLVSSMPRIAELLNAEYAYGFDDDALESVLDFYCVHRCIASGRLPPFLGWLNAAPIGSVAADYLQAVADLVEARLRVENGFVLLTLSEWPADLPPGRIVEAGRRLRDSTADRGCD